MRTPVPHPPACRELPAGFLAPRRPPYPRGKVALVLASVALHLGVALLLLRAKPAPLLPVAVFISRGGGLRAPAPALAHPAPRPAPIPPAEAGPHREAASVRPAKRKWARQGAPLASAPVAAAEPLAPSSEPAVAGLEPVPEPPPEGLSDREPAAEGGTGAGGHEGVNSDEPVADGRPVTGMLRMRVVNRIQRTVSAEPYPTWAEVRGWQGTVHVGFTVQTDGSLRDLRVVRSSGYGALDSAALKAVRHSAPFPPLPAPASFVLPMHYVLPR